MNGPFAGSAPGPQSDGSGSPTEAQACCSDLDACADLFAPGFTWHFFNPKLPGIEGDYHGVAGLKAFFAALAEKTGGSFNVQPVSVTPIGNELLVAHVRDTMVLDGAAVETDAVVVWRIVAGKIAEAWDIPAVYAPPG